VEETMPYKMMLQQSKWKIRQSVRDILRRPIVPLEVASHLLRRPIKPWDGHGFSLYTDIKRSGCRISTVFDVGANVGQSAWRFKNAFPDAAIYCFEPVKRTFSTLESNMTGVAGIELHQIALGSIEGEAAIYLTRSSVDSSLIRPNTDVGSEVVLVSTVDRFARDNHIQDIGLLKVDTEGFDLEVLKGAESMLSSGCVAFVLAEARFTPGEGKHVLFDDIRSYLLPMGYALFGIYDQQLEWSGEQRLRYANVCFCNV
jgi:FkbM family methyltransferase